MTRGQIVIITDECVYTTTEFNGDMYVEEHGHGFEVLKELKKIKSVEDYEAFVEDFNAEHFEYNEELVYQKRGDFKEILDMSKDYFGDWFSDYLYIKNLSSEPKEITLNYGKTLLLDPNRLMVLNFGNLFSFNSEQRDRVEFLEDLAKLRDSVPNGPRKDVYNKLYKECLDHDKYFGTELCDYIEGLDFVDEDTVSDFIRANADDPRKVRNYLEGTIEDDLYKLDGYENLQNIEDVDIEELVSDVMGIVHNEVTQDFANEFYEFEEDEEMD